LADLDVSANSQLRHLHCGTNGIRALNLSHNPALHTLICIENQLTALDISNNTKLERLFCESNRISRIGIGNNGELLEITCDFNNLSIGQIQYIFKTMSGFRDGIMSIYGNPGADKFEQDIKEKEEKSIFLLGWQVKNEKPDINDLNIRKAYYLLIIPDED
jgi:hypothetical protein